MNPRVYRTSTWGDIVVGGGGTTTTRVEPDHGFTERKMGGRE